MVTTFVVDSYASLQPDNTGELVFLMRQSLSQNYTFADGVLRPAVPFPSDTPFEAPLWALRVNGLWFASLIVSLSTASFGMLVKQWLNEYVAMDWITPEEQLRARQFRHRGLEDWKVFEIAAMLPLLLHVSLGLFFVGLCFYTAAANDIVGQSTFPLVSGWAFFALVSMVAPLASPRCPYKVSILKSALRTGRRYVTPPMKLLGSALRAVCRAVARQVLEGIKRLGRLVLSLYFRWERYSDHVIYNTVATVQRQPLLLPCLLPALISQILVASLVLAVMVPVFILVLLLLPIDWLIPFAGRALAKLKKLAILVHKTLTELADQEEGDIMRQPYATHELLLPIDKVIFNDGPVLETMTEVLRQARAPPASVSAFVLGCIHHRIGAASGRQWMPVADGHIGRKLSPQMLSDNAWNLLMGLAADVLQPIIAAAVDTACMQHGEHSRHAANCAALLLSPASRVLPEPANSWTHESSTRLNMLSISIDVLLLWPQSDVLDILWASFAVVQRIPQSSAHHRVWDHIPQLDDRSPTDLQEITCRILLSKAQRILDSTDQSVKEANLMLLYILGAAPPNLCATDAEQTLPDNSYYKGRQVARISHITDHLRIDDIRIALPLASILERHPSLTTCAINLYSIFVNGSLLESRPLWEVIREHGTEGTLTTAAQRALRDAWPLLLHYAESATADSSAYLQDRDFINLCLMLVRPTLLRSLDRSDPASDWLTLVPVLARTVDGTLFERDKALFRGRMTQETLEQQRSIPFLAFIALESLPPDDAEFPSSLRDVLAQLAAPLPARARHPRLFRIFFGTEDRRTTARRRSVAVLEEGLAPPMASAPEASIPLTPLEGATGHTNSDESGSRAREMPVSDGPRLLPVPPHSGSSIVRDLPGELASIVRSRSTRKFIRIRARTCPLVRSHLWTPSCLATAPCLSEMECRTGTSSTQSLRSGVVLKASRTTVVRAALLRFLDLWSTLR